MDSKKKKKTESLNVSWVGRSTVRQSEYPRSFQRKLALAKYGFLLPSICMTPQSLNVWGISTYNGARKSPSPPNRDRNHRCCMYYPGILIHLEAAGAEPKGQLP